MASIAEEFFNKIDEYFTDKLVNALEGQLTGIFNQLDTSVGDIGGMVSSTPQSWNGTIFTFIQNLSDNVVVPIAGLIITYVLIYELISMVMDKNNFHEFDSSLFFRYLGKACIAVVLVSHTMEIVEAIFELGGDIATSVTSYVSGSTSMNIETTLFPIIEAQALSMSVMELIGAWLYCLIIRIFMFGLIIYIWVLMLGRFMEIFLYMSVAPIPFATLTNKEWGNIGTNYIRGLLALAFQGFLIMACVGMYATLISGLATNISGMTDFMSALRDIMIYTVLLAMVLGKTSSVAKSIFNTH